MRTVEALLTRCDGEARDVPASCPASTGRSDASVGGSSTPATIRAVHPSDVRAAKHGGDMRVMTGSRDGHRFVT